MDHDLHDVYRHRCGGDIGNRAADLKFTLATAERTLSAQDYMALKVVMDGVTPFEAPFASRKPW